MRFKITALANYTKTAIYSHIVQHGKHIVQKGLFMARKRFEFWLNDQRQEDWAVYELIGKLKKANQFTRAIREGITLWHDLRAGNTDIFCTLFPDVAQKLGATVIEKPVLSGGGGAGNSDLAKEIAAQIVMMGGSGYVMQSAIPTTPKAPQPPTPKVEVKQAAPMDADAIADNFLAFFQ